MQLKKRPDQDQHGFTIVELMIATIVFSAIMLIITYGVLHFTSNYYRGINSSSTQNVANEVTNTIAQAIQFSGTAPVPVPANPALSGYLCAGNVEFAYNLGKEVDQAGSVKALLQYSRASGPCLAPSGTPTELLQPYMRLAQFNVQNISGNLWQINIKVTYGDNDLLCAPNQKPSSCSAAGSLTAGDFSNLGVLADLSCRASAGSQYCATVTLNTTVGMRVNSST